LEEYREGKRRDNNGTWGFGTGVASASWLCSGGSVGWWSHEDEVCEADVLRDAFEVLERRLGGDVGQEDNAAVAKKSAVRERDDVRSRGVLSWLGGELEESEKGLEKKAAVLDR
jgi:hypothetical protein